MPSPLIEIQPYDREFYESRLRDFLPGQIVDIHTHVWRQAREVRRPGPESRTVTWPARVAACNPVEDLLETYRLMLPGKTVTPTIFANPTEGEPLDAQNRYVAEAAAAHSLPSLILARPDWSAAELEQRILAGGFLGVKVYLTYAPSHIPASEIRIFDFLPPHQLEMLDRHGWIVMLHIPRPGRLRDAVNLAQLMEIERRYANLRTIVAHVGRAYCIEDVGEALEVLADTERLLFDISANTNAEVFDRLLKTFPPRRILFGSDMPVLRMRMRRICENGRYVNLVPKGMYGDVSGDPNMREVEGSEAGRLTFFLYEEIDAFRRAAEANALTRADIEDVFFRNANRVIDAAKAGATGP